MKTKKPRITRKMTITLTGKDGEKSVAVAVKFDPPVGDETPASGWQSAVSQMVEALQSMSEGK